MDLEKTIPRNRVVKEMHAVTNLKNFSSLGFSSREEREYRVTADKYFHGKKIL